MELKSVRRAFVDLPHGQVHLRTAGEGGVPLVMLHASPFSALVYQLFSIVYSLYQSCLARILGSTATAEAAATTINEIGIAWSTPKPIP